MPIFSFARAKTTLIYTWYDRIVILWNNGATSSFSHAKITSIHIAGKLMSISRWPRLLLCQLFAKSCVHLAPSHRPWYGKLKFSVSVGESMTGNAGLNFRIYRYMIEVPFHRKHFQMHSFNKINKIDFEKPCTEVIYLSGNCLVGISYAILCWQPILPFLLTTNKSLIVMCMSRNYQRKSLGDSILFQSICLALSSDKMRV